MRIIAALVLAIAPAQQAPAPVPGGDVAELPRLESVWNDAHLALQVTRAWRSGSERRLAIHKGLCASGRGVARRGVPCLRGRPVEESYEAPRVPHGERGSGRVSESTRMLDGSREPTEADVAEFIGKQNASRWAELARFIAANYPGVFNIEWLFGGQKYGWTLRFKKSKSFCSFVPERRRFKVLLVFGGAERQKVERLLPDLVSHGRDDYGKSTTYHDGKWVFVSVDSAKVVSDIRQLLTLKRQPKPGRQGRTPRVALTARARRQARG